MKEPESQERLDAEFNISGLSPEDCMSRVEDLLIELRQAAGMRAGEWLAQNGYFNGDIQGNVHHHGMTNCCRVEVVLTCFGLPLRIDEDQLRAIESCKRYFEHCERVSITGTGRGCDSVEMAVRQSLKREARDAVLPFGEDT